MGLAVDKQLARHKQSNISLKSVSCWFLCARWLSVANSNPHRWWVLDLKGEKLFQMVSVAWDKDIELILYVQTGGQKETRYLILTAQHSWYRSGWLKTCDSSGTWWKGLVRVGCGKASEGLLSALRQINSSVKWISQNLKGIFTSTLFTGYFSISYEIWFHPV